MATDAASALANMLREIDAEELPAWRSAFQSVLENPRSEESERKQALIMRSVVGAAMRGVPFEESLSVIAGANEKARAQ